MPPFTEMQNVLAKLQELQKTGNYIFRGQESFKFKLIPKAFRQDEIIKMTQFHGIDNKTKNNWVQSEEVAHCINVWAPGARNNRYSQVIIGRLLNYCLYLMILNHSVSHFANTHIDMISEQDKETLQLRNPSYWKDKKTFHYLFSGYFPRVVEIYDLKNLLLQGANPPEDLTGLDETLPQHYGAVTAALDWTHNFLVAMHFALGNHADNLGFLTIYALNTRNITNDSPIKLIDRSPHVSNMRAERQEGMFTYFTRPCSFYLANNTLPSINHYDSRYKNKLEEQKFELQEFRIQRTAENINFLNEFIIKHGITEDFLLPTLPSTKIAC